MENPRQTESSRRWLAERIALLLKLSTSAKANH